MWSFVKWQNGSRSLLRQVAGGDTTSLKHQKTAQPKSRPALEGLEDRTVPSTFSSITSNFNGTAIPAGDTVWFSAVMKVSGLGSAPVAVHVTGQTIAFDAGGTDYTLNVPDSDITFAPNTTPATTSFNAAENAWVSTLPSSFSGNAFLGGLAFKVPTALPGGINPVTWSGNFATDTAGVHINWQWAAGVYTNFASDFNFLNVKPLDSNSGTLYNNSDHAGTPEAFKSSIVGGARGGGGSNWTGSYSGTASVTPAVQSFEQPASISGYVLVNGTSTGLAGVTITLIGTDENGNAVDLTATTDVNGYYQFTDLTPGFYTLKSGTAPGYEAVGSAAGTVNGTTDGSGGLVQITSISLQSGNVGINYDFFETMPTGVSA
jgi:hypothetical protein